MNLEARIEMLEGLAVVGWEAYCAMDDSGHVFDEDERIAMARMEARLEVLKDLREFIKAGESRALIPDWHWDAAQAPRRVIDEDREATLGMDLAHERAEQAHA